MHIIHNHTTSLMSQIQTHTHLSSPFAPLPCTHTCRAHTKLLCEEPALLGGNNPLFLHVTLVPHQDDLRIVPGVGLDLSSPKERQRDDSVNDTLLGWKGPCKAHRSPFSGVRNTQDTVN